MMEEIFAFYTNVSVNRQLFRQIAVSGTVAAIDVVVSATHNTASFSPSAAHIDPCVSGSKTAKEIE